MKIKKFLSFIFSLALIASAIVPATAQTTHVSRDAQGWTTVAPSTDSRLVYVSSSGGNDANDGLSQDHPVKTLSHGKSLLRAGYPDWLLLKSGDIWSGGFGGAIKLAGRSADEPVVITSYGTGAKPQINPSGSGDSSLFSGGVSGSAHLYIIGLDFYDLRKDPSSPSFANGAPEVDGIAWIGGGNDLLVENCDFRFLTDGMIFQQYNSNPISGLTLRRNRVLDGYSFNSNKLGQGAFLYGIDGLTVEENIMDHNGFNAQSGVSATIFVHNIYIDECKNVTVVRNLLTRAGSLSLKFRSDHALASTNTLVEDNFIFESEVGLGAAADGSVGTPAQSTLTGFTIRNNVILQTNRDNPTGRGLGWGMSLNDIKDTTVTGNIVSDLSFTGNSFALELGEGGKNHPVSNVTVSGNIAYRIASSGMVFYPGSSWSNVTVKDNDIQNPDLSNVVAITDGNPASSAVVYSGNRYYNKTANPTQFASGGGQQLTYGGWVSASGETGSSYGAISYPDPGRNLETYSQALGQPATVAAFMAGARAQTKGNWQTAYTTTALNDYIRAGFGVAPLGSGSPPPVPLPASYTLAYVAASHGSLSGTATQTVSAGGSGTAVGAVPATGYHFVNWSDGSTANPRTDANVNANISATANFAINSYTLAYTAASHGSLSGTATQTVNYGASGTAVTAVPESGYQFLSWSDSLTANPRTDANVAANLSVTANFSVVSPSSGGGGSSGGGSGSGSGGGSSSGSGSGTGSGSSGGGGSSSGGTGSSGGYSCSAALAAAPNINADKGISLSAGGSGSSNESRRCVSGSLIKASLAAVYYCGADDRRYVFANDKIFMSWYDGFSGINTISDSALAAIPIGGNVTYRPGKRMVKIVSDPKVYAVDQNGTLRWVATEAAAARLYGAGWNKTIDDISDSLFVNYKVGDPVY